MNSKRVIAVFTVLAVIALLVWWRWSAASSPDNSPKVASNAPQAPRKPALPNDALMDDASSKPEVAGGDLTALATFMPTTSNQNVGGTVLKQLPPGAQLAEPLSSGRPTIVGQKFFKQQATADGKIIILEDELVGFKRTSNGQFVPFYSPGATFSTRENAPALIKALEANGGKPAPSNSPLETKTAELVNEFMFLNDTD
jgi:hypothetical protein